MDDQIPIEIRQTAIFTRWFTDVRDIRAKARITVRIRRLSLGQFGDIKSLGGGIGELRIDYGPGYRVYIARRGATLVLLLTGGDKSQQSADIERARDIAKAWESK
ncbi:type II toxin-antitoxin system RelE/ParE family toxin [Sphingomonas faeni]|uniref:type II toxin-antitoxin system RelE/ParE family toxin n=1 Tax=Sphingomonas faeni TaxID=185950 RepID=UPI003357CFD4